MKKSTDECVRKASNIFEIKEIRINMKIYTIKGSKQAREKKEKEKAETYKIWIDVRKIKRH